MVDGAKVLEGVSLGVMVTVPVSSGVKDSVDVVVRDGVRLGVGVAETVSVAVMRRVRVMDGSEVRVTIVTDICCVPDGVLE